MSRLSERLSRDDYLAIAALMAGVRQRIAAKEAAAVLVGVGTQAPPKESSARQQDAETRT